VKSLRHAIWTKDKDTQQDLAHWMIQIAKPSTVMRLIQSKLPNGNPPVQILKENAHLNNLEWNEVEQAQVKTLVERYTSQGVSDAWIVHRWQLACLELGLGVTKIPNYKSDPRQNIWQLDTSGKPSVQL